MVFPDVVGIGSEYFVVYFRMYVLVYICSADYVWLLVLLYLLQCLSITCYPKWGEALEFKYKVIGEVLVLGLLVVVYKIPYSSCMWTRKDVRTVCIFRPSMHASSGLFSEALGIICKLPVCTLKHRPLCSLHNSHFVQSFFVSERSGRQKPGPMRRTYRYCSPLPSLLCRYYCRYCTSYLALKL